MNFIYNLFKNGASTGKELFIIISLLVLLSLSSGILVGILQHYNYDLGIVFTHDKPEEF